MLINNAPENQLRQRDSPVKKEYEEFIAKYPKYLIPKTSNACRILVRNK